MIFFFFYCVMDFLHYNNLRNKITILHVLTKNGHGITYSTVEQLCTQMCIFLLNSDYIFLGVQFFVFHRTEWHIE